MKAKKVISLFLVFAILASIAAVFASMSNIFGRNQNTTEDNGCQHTLIKVPGIEPTCTEQGYESYYSCTNCDYVSEYTIIGPTGHSLTRNASASKYSCTYCAAYILLEEERISLIGEDNDYIEGVSGNSLYYKTQNGNEKPYWTDVNYTLIKEKESTGFRQGQFWIPSKESQEICFDSLSMENNSVAIMDFWLSTNIDNRFEIKLVEGEEGERWSGDWCLTNSILTARRDSDEDGHEIIRFYDNNNVQMQICGISSYNWTEFIHITIGIEFVKETNRVIFYYYFDSSYAGSSESYLTTANKSIKRIYFTVATEEVGTGIRIEDFNFGYTNSQAWPFRESR